MGSLAKLDQLTAAGNTTDPLILEYRERLELALYLLNRIDHEKPGEEEAIQAVLMDSDI